MAIIVYRTVQTGPNSQLGGAKLGLFKEANHSSGGYNAPDAATVKHNTINAASDACFAGPVMIDLDSDAGVDVIDAIPVEQFRRGLAGCRVSDGLNNALPVN